MREYVRPRSRSESENNPRPSGIHSGKSESSSPESGRDPEEPKRVGGDSRQSKGNSGKPKNNSCEPEGSCRSPSVDFSHRIDEPRPSGVLPSSSLSPRRQRCTGSTGNVRTAASELSPTTEA